MAIILDTDVVIRGEMSGYYDLIVAATARHRGSQLATFNRRHFEQISGLNLVML